MALADRLDAVRRPAYTGDNRCWPCTAVNAAIAVVGAVLIGLAVPFGPGASLAAAGLALGGFGTVIALRGYLVPGTPRLTRAFLPERVLQYFEHGTAGAPADGDVDPTAALQRAGAVTECADVDDLCLTDDVRAAWTDQIETLRESDATRDDLAALLDVPPTALEFIEHGDAFVAMADGPAVDRRRKVGQWESEGAFLADMAGARVLGDRLQGWSRLAPGERGQVLRGLRLFLERCPTCDGPVELGEETVESCCRSVQVAAVTCAACGDRLFEAERPAGA
ncbi:MAG: hypothetical protein ABEJ92_06475 [Halobacteriales archaeon]